MPRKPLESPFARAAAIILAAAIITLIPREAASHANPIGYKSLCTFAPWSTIILAVLAVMVYRLDGALKASERREPRRGF